MGMLASAKNLAVQKALHRACLAAVVPVVRDRVAEDVLFKQVHGVGLLVG